MSIFYDEINARIEYLTGIIYEKRENLLDIPEGNLRISVKRGHPHYYQSKKKGDTKGKYIKNDNIELARALAQKDYDLRVIKAAERELFHLKKIAAMEGRAAESIYGGFGYERKKLILPIELTDEEFIEQWYESKKCDPMGFEPDAPIILTSEDERVRSKSEQLWADTLIRLGIPKVYEPKLFLNGRGWVRPDFGMLNVRKRIEVYGEHFGMMDDPRYAEEAVEKLRDYERTGFILGYNLIVTMETRKYPLESKKLSALLKHHLL